MFSIVFLLFSLGSFCFLYGLDRFFVVLSTEFAFFRVVLSIGLTVFHDLSYSVGLVFIGLNTVFSVFSVFSDFQCVHCLFVHFQCFQ